MSDFVDSYEDQAMLFAFQGLMNRETPFPTLMYDVRYLNFDWPEADVWWKSQLEKDGRLSFEVLDARNVCDVMESMNTSTIEGLVVYETANDYQLSIALNVASQSNLLPVTPRLRNKYSCLNNTMPVRVNISDIPEMKNLTSAWNFAIEQLLPHANKSVLFNLYHKDERRFTDPQSNATVANLDYAIQQKAFITDLAPDKDEEREILTRIFSQMSSLFDAFGWAHDEHSWTESVSRGGGVVFCSFASPNLSFWSKVPFGRGGTLVPLPSTDSGKRLNRSKYYVTFETNEGDTPRIVVSAFGSSWASSKRGRVPVAWSVDSLLYERFPALMSWYAETATTNDSFIGGVAGAGYVYLNAMDDMMLERYTKRVGRLFRNYGPSVADVYGQANFSVMDMYSKYAKLDGGMAPQAYVTQPLWAHGSYAENAWKCPNSLNIRSTHTNTPIICTSNDPNLFYRNRGLDPDASNNGEILADRIRNVTAPYEPPFFVLIYGGLNWQPGSTSGTLEFWTLLESVMENLGEQYEAIGADEMARLSRDVCADVEMNSSSWVCSKNKTDN